MNKPIHITIDTDNIITAHDSAPAAEPGVILVGTEKDLKMATSEWPISRLVDVWNNLAGVVPFDDLKPVKKFSDRSAALKRIWSAMQRLVDHNVQQTKVMPTAAQENRHATSQTHAPTSAPGALARKRRDGTHSAAVIALLERAGGATLEEIGQATGWKKHTIRGFVSTIAKKHGHNVTSTRRQDGARVYAIVK
jgi:hypothetical protein